MKVVRLHGVGDLRIHDEPQPTPGSGEVLLRVTAVGLCGSDVHWFTEASIGDARLDKPLVLGHEFSAVIESGERRGERVAVDPSINCGFCEFCQEGNPHFCLSTQFAGHGDFDGAMREHMTWPARLLHHLPDSLTDADGVMLEPLGVAIHSVDLGHIRTGMSVGVFGCGPIGLLVMQVAREAGATSIFATEKLSHRLAAARSLSPTAAIKASGGRESDEIIEATDGRGVDVSFEVAGDNAAVEAAIASTRRGGRVVLIGIPGDDRIAFKASAARRRGLSIMMARRMKHAYPRAIRLVKSGRIDVRSLVTRQFPLEQAEPALRAAQRREGIKIIINP